MNNNNGHNLAISPFLAFVEEKNGSSIYKYKSFSAIISELVGTFMFVFLFMLCTDKKTQFSEDKVINCFIMASSYVAARLMSGGTLVTCLYSAVEIPD